MHAMQSITSVVSNAFYNCLAVTVRLVSRYYKTKCLLFGTGSLDSCTLDLLPDMANEKLLFNKC